ncbi:hypothetical protein GALMADRAFT_135635 [Galerina marginata CBS 339.88]|uniref:Bacterial alpha-L-rhamnosidase N-terminal domain-containing protein n=1 Tax=Galerina marginata (strain CBS 339.88) TaxID=685588 RepID=A0A067TGB9_GALM3|nr:hypothetical protein GALMADRAFT_135635 [Galerina marginata CBS 339.88]
MPISVLLLSVITSFLLFFCASETFAQYFSNSKWIWSNDIAPTHIAPPGPRAFRRYFYPKPEKTLLPCKIRIAAHDTYDLFVNGVHIGSGQRTLGSNSYSAVLRPGRNVFAIKATNGLSVPKPAGLLMDIQIPYTDGFTEGIFSDPTWRVSNSIPAGFENLAFDHSRWTPATVVTNYGSGPWDAQLSSSSGAILGGGVPKLSANPPSGNLPPTPEPAPIPKQEPKSQQPPSSAPIQVTPLPTPQPLPISNPDTKPVPKPVEKSETESNPKPVPLQTPAPKPETAKKPEPKPEQQKPVPTQKAAPKPEPTKKPEPKPEPKPVPAAPCPAKSSKALSITESPWIWTNEIKGGNAPIGARAFRKIITLPHGRAATAARVLLGVDDHFSFYVQGKLVGTGAVWSAIHNYAIDIRPAAKSEVVIAVNAANAEGGPAGLIAAIELKLEGCTGSVISITSDGTWKYSTNVPSGFEKPNFDDSKWASAKIEGKYGMAPWGRLAVPTAASRATV